MFYKDQEEKENAYRDLCHRMCRELTNSFLNELAIRGLDVPVPTYDCKWTDGNKLIGSLTILSYAISFVDDKEHLSHDLPLAMKCAVKIIDESKSPKSATITFKTMVEYKLEEDTDAGI